MNIPLKLGENASILNIKGGGLQIMLQVPQAAFDLKKGELLVIEDNQGDQRTFHIDCFTKPQGCLECVMVNVTPVAALKEPTSGVAQKLKAAQKNYEDKIYDKPLKETF